MNAGKHVVCEKPAALDSRQFAEMLACAEKNGVLFTVHQNRRWDEDFLAVKEIYDKNTLGAVFNIESRVHGSRGIPGDYRNVYDAVLHDAELIVKPSEVMRVMQVMEAIFESVALGQAVSL